MSPGDIIEFAVTVGNMNGLVDLESIQWEDIEILNINKNERDVLVYNRDEKLI